MDPALVILGGMIAIFVLCSLLLGRQPGSGHQPVGPDYAAMAETESHDVDDMLDAIHDYRRRTGRRDVGEEMADELLRDAWDRG